MVRWRSTVDKFYARGLVRGWRRWSTVTAQLHRRGNRGSFMIEINGNCAIMSRRNGAFESTNRDFALDLSRGTTSSCFSRIISRYRTTRFSHFIVIKIRRDVYDIVFCFVSIHSSFSSFLVYASWPRDPTCRNSEQKINLLSMKPW